MHWSNERAFSLLRSLRELPSRLGRRCRKASRQDRSSVLAPKGLRDAPVPAAMYGDTLG